MTTTSSICSIKSRLQTAANVSSMTNNAFDYKPSRISVKKPLIGFNDQLKKQNFPFNPFLLSKTKSKDSTNSTNSSFTSPTSPPLIFQPIPLSPTAETNGHSMHSNGYHQPENKTKDHTIIEEPLEKSRTKVRQSSESDNEYQISKSHVLLSVDTDADESDNEEKKNLTKTRRLQKTRKTSNSSFQYKLHQTPPTARKLHRSSSNDDEDDENRESISRLNESNFTNRRNKYSLNRKFHHFNATTTTTATTTTDEDTRKQPMRHQIVEASDGNSISTNTTTTTTTTTTNESTLSSPIPTMVAPVRKINRFQVKSIRKSQQAHLLLANAAATKSSNDDDCSVPNEKPSLQLRPAIIERQSTNTPTTDGENGHNHHHHHHHHNHHVRFQVTCPAKQELLVEEEKSVAPSTNLVSLPTPAPPSTNGKSHREDDEEEAVGNSPDGRFIKYAEEIGRGAFKTVYRGLDTETSVAVAWCELQDFAQFDRHERARFKEEAEMLKKLQHQNIVRFYDFWEETNPRTNKKVIILVTEMMTSGSLKSYIRKFKVHKEEKRINVMKKWCRQILKGLAYLHSRNPPVIHRDLKCDNVFISGPTGCVKIGDLGLATFKTQTFAKSMRGTMEFMAPEMFDEKYDELVDIYSFGLCMLEMITGEYPYIECKGPTAVIKRVTAGLKPECYYKVESEDVREVIDCCIRTKKEERLSVHDLLQHSFFLEDNGLRIDLVRDSSADPDVNSTRNESIDFKLKITDKSKRKVLWTEHEAIRFRYNVKDDTPEQIADELIEKKYIFDDDRKFVIQSIKDRLRAFNYEQLDRKAGIFTRDGKSSMNQTPSMTQQATAAAAAAAAAAPPPPPPQAPVVQPTPVPITVQPSQPATPPIVPPSLTPVLPITPTPSLVQPSPVDVPSQPATTTVVKASSDVPVNKPTVVTEPIPIAQLSELSSSVSGSAGSLEVLDAALKKTFHKNSISQTTTNLISVPSNDASELPTPLINNDESSTIRATTTMTNPLTIHDQSSTEEAMESHPTESINTAVIPPQPSTSIGLQSQSQPTTMVTNHQQQILTNPLPPNQLPQSFSYSLGTPASNFLPNPSANETIKSVPPSSSSTIESMENSHLPLSHTNETISSSILSDTPSTTQTQIPGSLKHLDALLTSTFKTSGKTNGTAYNSDTEPTSNTLPPVSLVINDELLSKPMDIDPLTNDLITRSDENQVKLLDLFTHPSPTAPLILHSQPNISTSQIITPSLSQTKSQPASRTMSSDFDPLISPEQNIDPLETLLKTPCEKSSSNDDTIIAASSNELSEIKSMLMDLSRTLLTRMTIIEQKIDEHRQQTQRIDHLLTQTVLPSLIDITDIIQETSVTNIDPRVRMKLESIRTNIRSTQVQQQQQQMEMKDLMEI